MEAKALRFYERRLEGSRRWSGKCYEKNKSDINLRRILDGISHGRVPTKSSVEKYDRAVIAEAWLKHVATTQPELTGRAKRFHDFICV